MYTFEKRNVPGEEIFCCEKGKQFLYINYLWENRPGSMV